MSDHPINILFLCTHNSCRSVIAESILNALGHGKFRGHSAGTFRPARTPSGRSPNEFQRAIYRGYLRVVVESRTDQMEP